MFKKIKLLNALIALNIVISNVHSYVEELFSDDVEVVQKAINSGANIEERNNFGDTPLLRAVWHNNIDIVRILIAAGADTLATNALGRTALVEAIQEGRKNMIILLMNSKKKKTPVLQKNPDSIAEQSKLY